MLSTEPRSPTGEVDALPPRPLAHHLALSVYWLSNTLLWGALLHLALQSRLSDWYGEERVGYYLGILGATGGVVATVAQIVAGAFSDRSTHRWGRRRPYMAAGTLLAVGGLMLLGAARSFWPFAGALILVQLFTNSALGPFAALLPDTVHPREHGKASGFMGLARLVGDTGGLILAAQLLTAHGLDGSAARGFHDQRMVLLSAILGGFMLVTMAFTCVAVRERPLASRPEAGIWRIIRGSFDVDVRGNPDFFWLSLSRAVTNLGFYMFLEVLMFFLKFTLGLPDAESRTMQVMLPAIACAAAISIPSGLLSDRWGRRPLVYAAQFVMATGALGFALAPNLAAAMAAAVPAGLAYGIFTAVEWAFACNLLPKGESARYLGVWNASAVVPQILAFPLGGALGSAISARVPGLGWRVDFGVAVVCCLVGAYFLKHVRERRGSASEGPATAPLH